MSRALPVLAAVVAATALVGCGNGGDAAPATQDQAEVTTVEVPRPLVEAARECGLADDDVLGDGGMSLTIRAAGEETSSDHDYEDIGCLVVHLETPEHVISHMDATRALDGMQEDEWGDLSARWTYHPNSGLNITFVDRSGS